MIATQGGHVRSLDAARRRLEARAKARAEAERADYEAKVAARETRTVPGQGQAPEAARTRRRAATRRAI